MAEKEKAEGMLSPYRVLDLTDEMGVLCGKIFGDMGADVIKVERPGGDPARNQGPFYHDEADPEKSLFWFAFNNSKRGITLDIETTDGQDIFRRLVKTADLVIESFPPGYMDKLGLGYSELEKVNPGIIMVSITPFGPTGPYKDYKAPDIVAWAMGGQMYPWGDPDRPPVRMSHHSHAHLHVAGDAAVGAMIALYHREMTGEGQQISASVHDSGVQATWRVTELWDMERQVRRRGETAPGITVNVRMTWPCKDGFVIWRYVTGPNAKRWQQPFIGWMDSEGFADDFLKELDFDTLDLRNTTQEFVDLMEEPTGKFFMAHTKAELYAGALKYNLQLYPVASTKDILESVQLAERKFLVDLEHPELGTSITYPGAFAMTSEAPPSVSRRAPLIGEHNSEIYEKDLGISKDELVILKQVGVI